MNEIYEFEGKRYDVAPNRLEEFLQKFPGATKVQEQEFNPGADFIETIKQPSVQAPLKIEEPKPSKASTLGSSLAVGFLEFAKGFENLKEGIQLGVAELLTPGEMTLESKKAALQVIRMKNVFGGSESYDPIIKKLEENIPEYKTKSITEDLEKGNYAQAGFRTVNAALRSAPSLVAAATGVGGLVALGASTAGNKFEEEFEADPEKSTGILLANAGVTGTTEAAFELVTRGLFKRAGFLKGQGNVKAAKELLQGGAKNIVKNIGFGLTAEGASEAATELTVAFEDYIMLGKELNKKDLMYRLGDAAIVGSFIGGSISSVGEITKTMPNAKNRAEAILMPENIKQQISKKADELNEFLDDLPSVSPEGKKIVNEKINEIEDEIIDLKKQSSSLINNLKGKDLVNYSKNIEDINNVKNVLKNAKTDSEKNIAEQKYKTLQEENISILKTSKAKAAEVVTKTVKEQIKEAGLEGEVVEMTSEEISNIKEKGFNSKEAAKQFGFINQKTDGSFTITLNKDKPMVGTAAHEFMHAVLFKTLGNNQNLQDNLGNALVDHVKDLGGETSVLGERLKAYGKFNKDGVFERDANFGEETITIMSEEIINGNLKFNENFFTKIGDIVRRFSQNYLGKEITFDTGRDVYNFVKDYSKSIKDGKINPAILRVAKEGAKGKLVEGKVKPETTVQMSKDASDNVQRIYEERGEAGAMDIIDAFKPITNKLVQRRSEAPNFDRQLLTDEIETGKRGIFDLIRAYPAYVKKQQKDGEKVAPLAGFINNMLPKRAIEASRRVLGEEFTEDVTEKVDIAAEEVTTETKAKPQPKKIVLADRLGIAKEVDAAVAKIIPNLDLDKITFKNLKNKVPSVVGKLFGIAPKKLITNANITKGELQKSQMFISKNADLLIKMLPEGSTQGGTATGVPNSLLKAFYTKTERAKAAKTGSKAGLAIQQKNNINKKDFLEVFGIVDGKPNRDDRNTSARVLALANTLGKMITNQAVRQQVKTESFRALEDGKSSVMFSKEDKAIADKAKQGDTYYKIDSREAAERYAKEDVPRLVEVFKDYPGLLNAGELVNGLDISTELKEIIRAELRKIPELQVRGNYPKRELSKYVGNKVSDMNESRIKEFNEQASINFNAHWTAIDKALSKDPTLLGPILIYLSNAQKSRTNIHRAGAEFVAYDKTVKGKLYLEHALQNVNAYRTLIEASINDKTENRVEFKKAFKALKNNYKLIGVSVADNKKLDDSGYRLKMPEGWNIFDNNWWERYSNEKINDLGGINFENFKVVGSKNNLAQEYSIPLLKPQIKANKTLDNAISFSRSAFDKFQAQKREAEKFVKSIKPQLKQPRGITILDFDDTLATTKSLVKFTAPDGTTGTLNAEQFASTYQDLQDQGYTFDFSDFNKVVKGKLAPLFQKALKLQNKFGPENMFVLTARPPASQKAIFDFLKANGLNIPLKNITGLGNSTAEAKALWVADKVAEGYNDFYFADDALQNVQAVKNMLDQFDVKSKVQQAKVKFSKSMDSDFNKILQDVTGIEFKKRFSDIKARKRGASKGKFRFFVPPSHEDFVGLLYNFMGKGRKGDQHRAFFEKALVRPLNRAYREIDTAKQAIANDYKALNKQFDGIKKKLRKKTPDGDFIFEDAVRIYLWNKHGYEIPGLSPTDQTNLVELVNNDVELKAYADAINIISKQDTYVDPGKGWEGGNIKTDLIDATGRVGREQYFAEFKENADIIFSLENLNKIEAAYGKDFRSALEDILHRISTGVNRPKDQSGTVNKFMNYLNGSVGTVMFFNVRSAILQQMSIVNYINFADNNIFAAAKAFANQKQYWKDFAFIFNSDMLKQRRGGIGTDINGADLAQAVQGSKDPTKVVISRLLRLGFLPTQIGDNIAIATGGATFYRNRINKYIKDGLSQKEAEAKAFTDFQDITQSTQQSSRPDMTSQQQASWIGKLVLNFQNITSQYNRIIKKAALDIKNGRISPPYTTKTQSNLGNLSKILYYGGIQNVIFYSLQTALFAVMFDDDNDEDQILKKSERVINGSIDSILRGSGIYGAVISTLKNTLIKFKEQREKGYNKDESAVLMELLNFSPVVGIKARQIVNAEKTINYNENIMSEMETFDAENPRWSAVTNYTQALTNFPANRLYQKTLNMRNALDKDYTNFQRALFFSGYTTWSLGLGDSEAVINAKEKVKINKKNSKKKKPKKGFKGFTVPQNVW